MQIPFLDLITPHLELEEELVKVFRECLRTASFVGGSQVQGFEEEFAQFCETKYCVAVNSGTDAIRFALIAAGIGPGDEVITVPNTFIATTEAISQTGANVAFVDIDEKTYNMDPSKLEDFLKKRYALDAMRSALYPLRDYDRLTIHVLIAGENYEDSNHRKHGLYWAVHSQSTAYIISRLYPNWI